MILNVIDNRSRKYRWRCVRAIFEDTHHDNSCKDADQARKDGEHQLYYACRENISVADAIAWGMAEKAEVTLYLYDARKGV